MTNVTSFNNLMNWVLVFRGSRKSIQQGSPIWAYKVTDEELVELQSILLGLLEGQHIHSVSIPYTSAYPECFVLYLATWLQRNNSGRAIWDPVLTSIGADRIKDADRRTLVSIGLRKWGLSVYRTDTSRRYIDTLACQGGFPRSDLLRESSSHIIHYFENVLRSYEKYQHTNSLYEVAVQKLGILPETLQQNAFADLVTRLIECLLEWKAHYNLGAYSDALKILDI